MSIIKGKSKKKLINEVIEKDEEIEYLKNIIDQQNIKINNLENDFETSKKEIEKVRKFLSVFSHLTGELKREEVLKAILDDLAEVVEAEAASIFILDEKTQELVLEMATNFDTNESRNLIRVPLGKGLAGHVAQTGELINIKDAQNDSRFYGDADKKTGFITRSILCVPIIVGKKIIGAAQAINKMNEDFFSDGEKFLFKDFAAQAAIAIENANLYDEIITKQENVKKQNKSLLKVADSAKYIIDFIKVAVDKVSETLVVTKEASKSVDDGNKNVNQIIKEMDIISDHTIATARFIDDLNSNINKIESFLSVIDKISDRTNVLSINAAIQASKAGNAGKSFVVVVEEIRNLSKQTVKASSEIGSMMKKIQEGSKNILIYMNGVVNEIQEGTIRAEESGKSLKEIEAVVREILSKMEELNDVMVKQSNMANIIKDNISLLDGNS